MRTYRLMALLDDLRRRSTPVSAETLAAEAGVSVRTIYRDMAALQAMGAPVRGEAGLGYQIDKGYFLPPLTLDADEMDALMLGLRLIAARGDEALAAAARRVSGKVAGSLPDEAHDTYTRLPLRAVSATGGEADRLAALRRAVRHRQAMRVVYRDLSGSLTERVVHPLGLTIFDAVWLLTCWCELRQEFRNLRLDRMETLAPTGETFRPTTGRRFEDYLRTL